MHRAGRLHRPDKLHRKGRLDRVYASDRRITIRFALAVFMVFLFMTNMSVCRAEGLPSHVNQFYQNETTGYCAKVEDSAELLSEEEEADLLKEMQDITAYGNAAFKSVYSDTDVTEEYAREYYKVNFGTTSGTLFLIDMQNRMLWIHSDGAVYKVITRKNAEIITDNVYRDASKENYYACASEAFQQIKALLRGNNIPKPMKYISNALWAMILAMLVNFGLVCYLTNGRSSKKEQLLEGGRRRFEYTTPDTTYVKETRIYHDPSDEYNDISYSGRCSSGFGGFGGGFRGGGGFGGGFRGGGGRRSGGGGGHRF